MMFLNEIRKYRGARWLLFLLAGLMLASFLVCWFVLKEDGIKKYGKDADKTYTELVSYYSENDDEREDLRKSSAEQSNALFAQVREVILCRKDEEYEKTLFDLDSHCRFDDYLVRLFNGRIEKNH